MSESTGLTLIERSALSDDEAAAVRQLDTTSQGAGQGEARIIWDTLGTGDEQPNQFLAYAGERLVGYMRIEGLGEAEAEATALLAPNAIASPIITQLVEAALRACRASKTPTLIVALDRRATAAAEAIARRGAEVQFSEQKLRRESTGPLELPASDLTISVAGPDDTDDIAAIQAEDMGIDPTGFGQHIARNIAMAMYRYYIARHAGAAAGTANVQQLNGDAYIYGLVVRPEYRGRGYGRLLMLRMLADLAAAGDAPMFIEVVPENTPAATLYHSLGFTYVTTFDYYRLDA